APFDEFRQLVTQLGIARRLVVLPRVLDIENYIHAADAGLYASEKESFGMGVLETMSYGKTVVATRVGGVAEIIEHGESGRLSRMSDVAGMAAYVRKLAGDRALLHQMGASARKRAAEHFSPQQSVEKYVELYRRTTSRKKH